MSRQNPNFRLICPAPYKLDPTVGLCVEPAPAGFTLVNGSFLRNCPDGMRMNDLGVCIRPVMGRTSFVNENSIQQTTLAIAGQKTDGGASVIFGSYDQAAYDMTFVNSVGLQSGVVQQVLLSDGSQGLFIVAQDRRGGQNATQVSISGSQNFEGLTMVTQLSAAPAIASANSPDQIPDASVVKVAYTTNENGQVYILGNPRSKIFLANYSASLYSGIGPKSAAPKSALFEFQKEAYSVSGTTDPYYVGSYDTLNLSSGATGDLVSVRIGALQNGLDADSNTSAPAKAPVDPGPSGSCNPEIYVPQRPSDPVPQMLDVVSDATSRNFTTDALNLSNGFVVAGVSLDQIDPSKKGLARAVRYLDDDVCTLNSPPNRPTIQALTSIDLSLGQNDGDIRVARFDIEQAGTSGVVDTMYVFGSDPSNGSRNDGPVLSFITENTVYFPKTYLTFTISINGGTEVPCALNVQSINAYQIFTKFALIIESTFQAEDLTGFTATVDLAFFNSDNKLKLTVEGSDTWTLLVTSTPEVQTLLGITATVNLDNTDNGTSNIFTASDIPDVSAVGALAAYNGLSWDDLSGVGQLSNARQNVTAMPTKFTGQGLEAWSYDAASQSLGFAIGNVDPQSFGATLSKTVTVFETTDTSRNFVVPDNCIDLEVHMWGAGGSSDPNALGTGGAGAYVGGHISRSRWTPGTSFNIVVGSGGSSQQSSKITEGQGGTGSRNNIGRGGGRSAIQIGQRDILTAGGGGGSVGAGRGGAASATSAQAENGLPDANGGRGATPVSPGAGGILFGDSRYKKTNDGRAYSGASSGWNVSTTAIGGGGGGSGYYGGGAGGYLGTTGSPNDLPCGGGGGSSYTSNFVQPVTISGVRDTAPYKSNKHYIAGVAQGGSHSNHGIGGPGLVVIIATCAFGFAGPGPNWTDPTPQSQGPTIWASPPNAFRVLTSSALGSVSPGSPVVVTPADWSSIFTQLILPQDDPAFGNVRAMYVGLGGLVVVVTDSENGLIVGPNALEPTFTYVWWTILSGSGSSVQLQRSGTLEAFGPIGASTVVMPISNVRAIRALEPINGSRDLIFIGDGIRIVTAPSKITGTWSNPRYIVDNDTLEPLDSSVSFADAQFNENNASVEATGRLSSFGVTTMHKTPWAPMFASFYDAADVTTEITPYNPWYTNASWTPFESVVPLYSNHGLGAVIGSADPYSALLLPNWTAFDTYNNAPLPNTIFCMRLQSEDSGPESWLAVNLYSSTLPGVDVAFPVINASSAKSGSINPIGLRLSLQNAIQNYLNFLSFVRPTLVSPNGPKASVVLGPYNVFDITITGLGESVIFEMAFTSTDNAKIPLLFTPTLSGQTINNALSACGQLLGFGANIVGSSITDNGDGTFDASFTATSSIETIPSGASSTSRALTPLSVAAEVNSAYTGSLYHVYAPKIKFATKQPDVESPLGLVVSIGGPIADPIETIAAQPTGSTSLWQPVPARGSNFFIDFVFSTVNTESSYSWQVLSDNGDVVSIQDKSVLLTSPIRPPANILSSVDGGASYGYAESLLGSYLSKQDSNGTAAYVSTNFAMTALDAFHTGSQNGVGLGVGPARFRSLANSDGSTGQLNAAVSQFNDVIYIEVPVSIATQSSVLEKPGYFVAVGQFVWELNAVLADTSLVKWPSTWHNLPNVCWVSIDGITWTTLPIIKSDFTTASAGNTPELFWMVYKIDYVDSVNYIGTILTDVGLYKFDARALSGVIGKIFGHNSTPVLDFTINSTSQAMIVNPIGRTGNFAAVCTSRDPTGTCIKCLGDNARPVSIPQIVGPGGVIQPNFDTCIKRPENPNDSGPQGYTSVESGLDAWAIAAYAGFDAVSPGTASKNSSYVNGLRQSFYTENALGNSLVICPLHTDASTTPSTVNGRDSGLSNDMLCSIDNAMQKPLSSTSSGANTSGIAIVRRPAKTTTLKDLDNSYDGTYWQNEYAYEVRHLIFTAYDSFGSTGAMPAFLPDSCPSTLGLGGSAFDPPTIGISSVYPNGLTKEPGMHDVNTSILAKITNVGAFNSRDGMPLAGPFTENKSLFSAAGAGYDPNVDFDRAVLANGDTLDQFAYDQYAGGPSGVLYSFDGLKQVRNDNLYRLSSYEFPFDGQATLNATSAITVGRDPQVYEPGFGPLMNYLSGNSTGFAVSKYNSAITPWPANPLPQEGLGHWWIRPVLNANGTASPNSVFQSALGYGTLTFTQKIDSAHAFATGNVGSASNTFMFDTSLSTGVAANNYMNGPWTNYLPFNGFTAGLTTSKKASAVNVVRNNRAKYAIQNLLALRLLNKPNKIYGSITNNFAVLVTCNFYRPRNWAFLGLALDTNGIPFSKTIDNGISQQILASDQPNRFGQYEFLVPDPYFAAIPVGRLPNGCPLGIQSQVWTYQSGQNPVQGPEYALLTSVLSGASLPSSLTVVEGTIGGTMNWPEMHNAFHYWTYGSTSILDIYINISAIFKAVTSYDFDWLEIVMPETKWTLQSLPTVLQQFAENKSAKVQNVVNALIAFNANPMNNFVWTDPGAQTTRSLKSMSDQGLNVNLVDVQAISMVGLELTGLKKRAAGQSTSVSDYSQGNVHSLLHYKYSVVMSAAAPLGQPIYKSFLSANQNASCSFGADSASNGVTAQFGHVPPADPRGFSSASNFVVGAQAVNVYSSDYDIERDNSAVFAELQRPASIQDLLAQNYSGLGFGDPTWGFGHRLDINAVVPEVRLGGNLAQPRSLTTNGALPTDHGYVSMVRTSVDSHERYQISSTPSLEKFPHAQRLTYVTKYVPSNLKNYGAIVQLQAMRPLLASKILNNQVSLVGTRQNLLNPFKPQNCFFVENVPTVQWYRPTATGRNYGGTANTLPGLTQTSPFSATQIMWRACKSDCFDVEAPGYYGRQKLTLTKTYEVDADVLSTTENVFFDGTGMPKAKVFQIEADTTAEQPIAGYQEILDNTKVFGLNSATALSFRSLGPTVVNSITNNVANSSAYFSNLESSNVIFGQMLINLVDAFDPTDSSAGTQIDKRAILHIGLNDSLGLDHQTLTTTFYSSNISIQQFLYQYIKPAYATIFGYTMPNTPTVLVTHAEFAAIASIGIQAWINATISASGSTVTVTSNFDVLTDRPDFKFSINGSQYFRTFRMYLAPPVSNWLGLCPVVPPMFDMSAVRFSQPLYIKLMYSYGFAGQHNLIDGWDWYSYVGNYYANQGALNTAWMSIYDFALMVKDVSYDSFPELGHCKTLPFSLPKGATLSRFYYLGEVNTFRFYVRNQCEVIMRAYMQVNDDIDPTKPSLSKWSGLTAANSTEYPFLGVSADDFQHTVSQPAQVQNIVAPLILWDPTSGLWYTMNGTTRGPSENAWTPTGWAAVSGVWAPLPVYETSGAPMYSLYFDTSGNFDVDYPLYQNIHFAGTQNTLQSFSVMCDISNVSWSTRLNTSIDSYQGEKCSHYWGVVSNASLAVNVNTLSVYHADAHVKDVAIGTSGPVISQKILNSTNFGPNFMSASGFTKTPFTDGTSLLPTSSSPYLDCAAFAAIQVPCPYGGNGLSNTVSLGKPAPYDSSLHFDSVSNSGAPSSGTIAALSLTSASQLNWMFTSRDCYSAISSVSPSATGDLTSPFQLQLLPSNGVSLVPSVASNTWSITGVPVAVDALKPGLGPSGKATLTNACATSIFVVQSSCFINVGPTPMSYADVASTTRMALYAFNYSDLFASSEKQPWNDANGFNNLRSGNVLFSASMKTYLQCTPYFMDEGYDNGVYSSLGRSFFIGPSAAVSSFNPQRSSATGDLLVPTSSNPVIVIFAPATGDPTIIGGYQLRYANQSTAMLSTYSNSSVYSFTEPYSQAGQQRAIYSIAFTDPLMGPAWTFYGLDNNAPVTGEPAGSTSVKSKVNDLRKVYIDLGSLGQPDSDVNGGLHDSSSVLGLDVRQVYAPVSLGLNAESNGDPYAGAGTGASFNQFPTNAVGLSTTAPWALQLAPQAQMTLVTYESPNWSTAKTFNAYVLPLAGTWNGDLSTGVDTLPQSVPNYEGLSLVSEWTSVTGSPGSVGPNFTQWAVDRTQGNIGQQFKTNENPFSAAGIESYRPQTVFTLLCDLWRNTIRQSVRLKDSAGNLSGAWNANNQNNGAALVFKTIPIDFVDCMGPSEYDSTIQITSQYFGMCNGTLNGTDSQPAGLQQSLPSIATTPWTIGSKIWSPFTGGSYWNTFQPGATAETESDPNRYLFPPNIWWPTYRWLLGDTDPNNVWPTGVTSNPNLLQSNYFVFGCTDGTIRKVYVPGGLNGPGTATSSQPYPVVESTNIETFYNDGVNQSGDNKVFSYSPPGRLYNLTWWANNWWATADNSAVWTTAPLSDLQQTPINDQIVVNQFVSDIIKFRPLSASEGHPPNWLNAQWPSNEAHKYNCMRIIMYQGASALFVGSVDGEYLIITEKAGRYESLTPNGDPQAWGFQPASDYAEALDTTALHVTDITTVGQNLIVGTMPLPLDPQVETSVPWFGGITTGQQNPLPLPLLSLGYAPASQSPIAALLSTQNWPLLLVDSNVVTVKVKAPYDPEQSIQGTLANLTLAVQTATIGVDAVASNYQNGYEPGTPATGLRRFVKPTSTLQERPNDKAYAFYPEGIIKLDSSSVIVGYGLHAEASTEFDLGNTVLAIQHNGDLINQVFATSSGSSVNVPMFYAGGLDFDRLTRAFFVIDKVFVAKNDANLFGFGLKKFLNTTSQILRPGSTSTNLVNSYDYRIAAVQSGANVVSGIRPMYTNSLSYKIALASLQNSSYGAVIERPTFGPLSAYSAEINDYENLNLFQNMNVRRAAPILANLVVSDFAYGPETQAVAFTTYGPYGAESPTIASIAPDGSFLTLDKNSDFAEIEARLIGPSLIGWSPYELKWYVTGVITNMPDWELVDGNQLASLRPAGVPARFWPQSSTDKSRITSDPSYVPKKSSDSRFAILSADASSGITSGSTSINFTQVYSVLSKTQNAAVIRPLASTIYNATCFGFSPNVSAIGCCVLSTISSWPTSVVGTTAAVAWRTATLPAGNDLNANWSILNLGVPGSVTAIKYVGYAWYIATWDPYANFDAASQQYEGQSTLFFASINFNAVSPLDSWSANQIFEVRSIDASTPSVSKCTSGFEPDPNNPNVCVKICPTGFVPFGQLCVQKCVGPYVETGVPNECKPDAIVPKYVSPTAFGSAPTSIITPKLTNPSQAVQGERPFEFLPLIIYGLIYAVIFVLILGIRANWHK